MIYQIYHKLPQLRFFLLFPSSSALRPLTPRAMPGGKLLFAWLLVGPSPRRPPRQRYPGLMPCALPQLWQDSHAALPVRELCSIIKNATTS